MAIAYDNATGGNANPATSLTFSHTTSGSDRALFVGVVSNDTVTDDVTGVTYGGVSMTRLIAITTTNSGLRATYIYYLLNPASGANNVVISVSASTYIDGVAVSYTGVKQSGMPDASTSTDGSGSGTWELSVSLASVADNCWHAIFVSDNNGGENAGTGTTVRIDRNISIWGDSNSAKTPAGSVTLAGTSSGTRQRGLMISFAPAAASSNSNFPNLLTLGVG